ncbi:MAG TPA: phosphotransferase [Candidatus Acidoferrum sp.]|nr:phosphotransferase [Candidatus Acidoferrum sp.]
MKQILNNWGLSNVKSKKIDVGLMNQNWLVTEGKNKYILRKVVAANERNVRFELKYLTTLKRGGLRYSIPVPMKTVKGDYLVKEKGSLFWMYEYIDGTHVYNFDFIKLREISKMLAEYHNILIKNKKFFMLKSNRNDPYQPSKVGVLVKRTLTELNKKRNHNTNESTFIRYARMVLPIADYIAKHKERKLEYYYLYNDISKTNLIWKNGKLNGLIDFDFVHYGNLLIKDLAIVIQRLCHYNSKKYVLDLSKVRVVIETYSKIRKLTLEEKDMLIDMILTSCIGDFDFLFHIIQGSSERKITMQEVCNWARMAEYVFENRQKIRETINT